MKHWKTQTYAGLVLVAALLWISPVQLRADAATPQDSGSTAKQKSQTPPTPKASARTGQQRSAHRSARRRVSSKARRAAAERRRRARMRPAPERIQEIQRALVQAGYSKEEPNGRWDEQTREAMRRYQADHGFPVTGLPEAKSLMKLGLGPHPLPADLESSNGAKAGADTVSNTPAPPTAPANPITPDAQQSPPTTTTPP